MERSPGMRTLLETAPAVAVAEQMWDWHGVPLPLRVTSRFSAVGLPDELITSVRCLVGVGDGLVVCETPLDVHVMPGGRREAGESLRETAVREVREETGWEIATKSLVALGFLHFEHLATPPADYPYPSPDFLQLVFTTRLAADAPAPQDWTDQEGWEARSRPVARGDLAELPLSPVQWTFIDAYFGMVDAAAGG